MSLNYRHLTEAISLVIKKHTESIWGIRDNKWKFWNESKKENDLTLQFLKVFWFFLHLSASGSLPSFPLVMEQIFDVIFAGQIMVC